MIVFALAPFLNLAAVLHAQSSTQQPPDAAHPPASGPIAIVAVNGPDANANPTVTGVLEIAGGKAMIVAGGSVTAGDRTTTVVLPHRGTLRVCATTTVKLASDSSAPAGDAPGLLMAIDHGAMETSYATSQSADVILTPQFRILIGGPGASELKVRLGDGGDTCVDNAGQNAPYVVVSSLFEDGLYRVQPGQRVMFQHGSLHQVVDDETEPCGCPPPALPSADGNAFPLAQSEGLAPLAPAPAPIPNQNAAVPQVPPLVYSSPQSEAQSVPALAPAPAVAAQTPASASPAPQKKKSGFFQRVGNFFKKIFGAE